MYSLNMMRQITSKLFIVVVYLCMMLKTAESSLRKQEVDYYSSFYTVNDNEVGKNNEGDITHIIVVMFLSMVLFLL